ncbi:MAG: Cof-type HAD-IIB family hydrolase, partial [Haemophilus parahaemolyticus]|nr:Cof-type HAD-IIB family hydrolase [Haemophilus parahaemolyticus]
NAEPELKSLADFVTKDIHEDGILYALEELGVI